VSKIFSNISHHRKHNIHEVLFGRRRKGANQVLYFELRRKQLEVIDDTLVNLDGSFMDLYKLGNTMWPA
jgi:hypothetical protein